MVSAGFVAIRTLDRFALIEKLLPGRRGHVGRDNEFGNRLFVEAVIWKFRTGVR